MQTYKTVHTHTSAVKSKPYNYYSMFASQYILIVRTRRRLVRVRNRTKRVSDSASIWERAIGTGVVAEKKNRRRKEKRVFYIILDRMIFFPFRCRHFICNTAQTVRWRINKTVILYKPTDCRQRRYTKWPSQV